MNCNEENAHVRDCRLSFDAESHRYMCDGREFTSVTNFVEQYFVPFDAEKWAPRVAVREGVSVEEILDRWEREGQRARDLGTRMHDKIERYYLGDDDGDDTDAFRLFREFARHNTLYPYRTEWRIFHEDHDIAGTLDFLERRPDGTFVLWDWKRSAKLVDGQGRLVCASRFGQMGLEPLHAVQDVAYWHYALQLSVYRFVLEERYGIGVSRMRLGVFHPDYDKAWVVDVPYMRDHVVAMLRHRLSHGRRAQARLHQAL